MFVLYPSSIKCGVTRLRYATEVVVAVVHAVFKHEQILKTLQHMQQTAATTTTTTTVVSTVTEELKTARGHQGWHDIYH